MADQVPVSEVVESMFLLVKDASGKKNLKPTDVTKAMIAKFGADRCDKILCKQAIRELVDSGRLVYSYFGGSFLDIPHKEGAEN